MAGEEEGDGVEVDHVLQKSLPDLVFEGSASGSSWKESEIEGENVSARTALESGVDDGFIDGTYYDGGGGCDADACLDGMANSNECRVSPMEKAKIGRA